MYSYESTKPKLFNEANSTEFIKFRDNALRLLKSAGAFMGSYAFNGVSVKSSDIQLAFCDRLVEIGDVIEIEYNANGQDRIFRSKPT